MMITRDTACVVVETIQAEAGVLKPREGYMKELRSRCHQVGAILILDEIQVGAGRTGKMFAFEHYGIQPDILLLAKGMGGGMPLGCFIANHKMMEQLTFDPALGHITTFGGHPVSCAAALKTIEIISESGILETVEEKGQLFEDLLSNHQAIKEIRRAGLLLAVELTHREKAASFIKTCMESGFLMDFFLWDDSSFRIAPPLTILHTEIEMICEKLIGLLDEII